MKNVITTERIPIKMWLDHIDEDTLTFSIIHSIRNKSDLEEASSCYKDIHQVMILQNDLVKIRTELSPLAVVKG